jgi:hypothetical protein
MDKYRPKYCIEIRFGKTQKFSDNDIREYHYPQPVEYCNGKSYWEYNENSYERNNWGLLYSQSYIYNEVKKICKYDDPYWYSTDIKDKAFEVIFNSNAIKEKVFRGSPTELKTFEIYLLNKGYLLHNFGMLNAYCTNRIYKHPKTQKCIILGFGLKHEHLRINFYFSCSDDKHCNFYQVPVKEEDFEKAENCQLESFQKKIDKILHEKNIL